MSRSRGPASARGAPVPGRMARVAGPDELLALAARWARTVQLDPATARVLDSGWDVDALMVRGTWTGPVPASPLARAVVGTQDWVFRFPRRPEVAELMEVEIRLLPVLAPQLPVRVPHIAVLGMLPDGEHRFTGAPALAGEPVTAELVTGPRGGLLVSQLAGVLAALHRASIREVVAAGVRRRTVEEWRAELAGVVERATTGVPPEVAAEPAVAAEVARVRAALADDRLWPDRLTVVHGDLGTEHVLADPERGVLTGVIDWTDARIADPAMDFADLAGRLGGPALARVLDEYADAAERPPDDHFADRIALYRALLPFHTIRHGLDTEQAAHVSGGVRSLLDRAPGAGDGSPG